MKTEQHAYLLAGTWQQGTESITVRCSYDDSVVGVVSLAGPAELEQAIQAAQRVAPEAARIPAHRRASILRAISAAIQAEGETLARTLALEAAKPITQARAEIQRSAFTFAYAADEAGRSQGEVLALDAAPGGENRLGLVKRFPVGPIAAITPFNFPLNLAAHKLAPAIAAGCPVILKPALETPLATLALGRIVQESGWPTAALSVLPLRNEDASPLIEDERIKMLSFTGSPRAGWAMKARAGRKKVTLELGGNAGLIVHQDADLARAVARTVVGGFSYAGQSCISVQRIYVHHERYHAFLEQLVPAVQQLRVGAPLDEQSDLSSLIRAGDAERVLSWITEAKESGARVLTGGERQGNAISPTVLVDVAPEQKVSCREIFGPVVIVSPYETVEQAIAAVNDSDFGLQAGIFTNDLALATRAFEQLEVGGVIVNDVPTWRLDHMPYGGVKQSGFGREGLRYAIEEMTEPRLLAIA